jgi:catechol 2,3-dioxygenase-like lactoylglutathione lyase family enzyme
MHEATGSIDAGLAIKKIGSINHLRLTVTDIGRAKGFYDPLLEFLGYRLVECSDRRLAWAGWAGHGNLHWFIVSLAAEEHMTLRHNRYAPGFHHLAFNADSRIEVDRFYDLLMHNEVSVLDPPKEYDYEPGYYAVFFADPDGLKLELVHVPMTSSQQYWHTFVSRGHPLEI